MFQSKVLFQMKIVKIAKNEVSKRAFFLVNIRGALEIPWNKFGVQIKLPFLCTHNFTRYPT